MGKTFADYQAEHLKEPFQLPMPDGTSVPIRKASIEEEREVKAAVAGAGADATPFTGIELLVGDEAAANIVAAWGALPGEAWSAAMTDMRAHFGQGNSPASPAS